MGEKFCDDCLVHLESDLYTKDGGDGSRPEVTEGQQSKKDSQRQFNF